MTNEKLDSLAILVTLVLVFLLPIFVVPFVSVSASDTKLFMLGLGVFLAGLLWSVARLKDNTLTFPKGVLAVPLLALPIVALISSALSGSFTHSLLGQGFALDTVLFLTVMSAGFGIGAFLFTSKDKVITLYLTLAVSALIFFVYHVAQLFLSGGFSPLNVFPGGTSNLIGKWNDVAIFSGLIVILSLITLDVLRPRGLLKVLSYINLIAGLFMIAVVHFALVWIVLAGISALLFIRSFFETRFLTKSQEGSPETISNQDMHPRKISGFSLFVLVISAFFIFAGPSFEKFIDAQFNTFQVEARPSWQSTFAIFEKVYREEALFGAGPNNFTKEWLLSKPLRTNQTPFWDVDFSFGVGIIPTLFITNGILGALVWLAFFILFLVSGARTFLKRHSKLFDDYLATSSFFAALFLWILSVFYVPHVTLFFLAFLFSGIFIAAETWTGRIRAEKLSFNENPRIGFAIVALLFVLVVSFALGLYASVEKFVSSVYIERAGVALRVTGNLSEAQRNADRALLFSKSDQTHRASAEIFLLRLAGLLNQDGSAEELQGRFQSLLTSAIENAQKAVSADERNYQNWALLGRIYETLIPLRINGAYDNAKIAYEQARTLNPNNPRMLLNLARVEALNGNNQTARDYIGEALRIKNDYTNAISLLSQIEIGEGNTKGAIQSVEAATLLSPQDSLLFFQLGLLKYSTRDFSGAIGAFERAVSIDSRYANARYFLGLSYYEAGRTQDAIRELTTVKNLDPGNSEVNSIIENLIVGRAPFENFTPPLVEE
ncbi:tetratricopeptide repeat protein [Candidatus Kaiserbacteria bacterium]|nr:tetratricopeptide repeat protein [Candidatus Kaiserbacteria bacterium]